jgi:dihydroflavonol-4-reductase
MTVVVTGASGHVGANLVRMLLARGERVRALVRERDTGLAGLPIERMAADVRDPATLRPLFEGADVVYHLAALISIDGDRRGQVSNTNVEGAANVARAALEAGVSRLVHTSSIHAFDQVPLDQPLDETRRRADERTGHPAYDVSKARGERAVRAMIEAGLDAVIVNPTAIIGPHDYEGSRMGRVFVDLARRRLPTLIEGGFDWVDVRDVCTALVTAAERGRRGESYLVGGQWASVAELAGVVEELTGIPRPRVTSPMWLARLGVPFVTAVGRITGREPLYTSESLRALRANRNIDCGKARRELGHAPRPLRETIRDTLAFYAERGTIPSPPAPAPAGAAS